MLATPLNRPAFARLEYTRPGRARARRAFVRHCKKLGANRRRKATERQSPPRVRDPWCRPKEPSSGECSRWAPGNRPQTPTPKPGGGAASTDQWNTNDQAVVAGRQELQVVHRGISLVGNHGSATPALADGGRSKHRPPSIFKVKTAMPNPAFKRTRYARRLPRR